jgi:hypothetical protein
MLIPHCISIRNQLESNREWIQLRDLIASGVHKSSRVSTWFNFAAAEFRSRCWYMNSGSYRNVSGKLRKYGYTG